MKMYYFIIPLFLLSSMVVAQNQMGTLSGGYTFGNIEDEETEVSGFRINGLYEYRPIGSNLLHGFSFGFMQNTGDITGQAQDAEAKVTTWPIYYAPKFLIGKGSGNFFVKGALGLQFSSFKRTGGTTGTDVSTSDAGFYGGLGAGFMKTFKESMFINVEYEWSYSSNSYYKDGFFNSIMLGIGKIF